MSKQLFSITADGIKWHGWASRINCQQAVGLFNELEEVAALLSFVWKNRWALKPGTQPTEWGFMLRSVTAGKARSLTHAMARKAARLIAEGEREAGAGNADRARLRFMEAELFGSAINQAFAYPMASHDARRRVAKKKADATSGAETRAHVLRVLESHEIAMRYSREITAVVADRVGVSEKQARAHIHALGYGAKNSKGSR